MTSFHMTVPEKNVFNNRVVPRSRGLKTHNFESFFFGGGGSRVCVERV